MSGGTLAWQWRGAWYCQGRRVLTDGTPFPQCTLSNGVITSEWHANRMWNQWIENKVCVPVLAPLPSTNMTSTNHLTFTFVNLNLIMYRRILLISPFPPHWVLWGINDDAKKNALRIVNHYSNARHSCGYCHYYCCAHSAETMGLPKPDSSCFLPIDVGFDLVAQEIFNLYGWVPPIPSLTLPIRIKIRNMSL